MKPLLTLGSSPSVPRCTGVWPTCCSHEPLSAGVLLYGTRAAEPNRLLMPCCQCSVLKPAHRWAWGLPHSVLLFQHLAQGGAPSSSHAWMHVCVCIVCCVDGKCIHTCLQYAYPCLDEGAVINLLM